MNNLVQRKLLDILLIEDNDDDIFLINLALKKADIQSKLTVIHNGEDAVNHLLKLEKIKEKLPALILLDVNLPKINGLEVLSVIESLEFISQIPVVVLTSSDIAFDLNFSKNKTSGLYVKKPNNINGFIDVMAFIKEQFMSSLTS